MQRLLALFLAMTTLLAFGDDTPRERIAAVLARSQRIQLDALTAADASSVASQRVRASFQALVANLHLPEIELTLIRGPVVAETLHGHVLVANESLGKLSEGQRRFILAHEMGHVMLGHWAQMVALYEHWIPGDVTPTETDAVANRLGRDASALAHQQEYEADAFGARLLADLGLDEEDAVTAFMSLGVYNDTATHPGTMRRVAALRAAAASPTLQAAAMFEPRSADR